MIRRSKKKKAEAVASTKYLSWENNDPNPPGHWGSGIFQDDNFAEYIAPGWVFPGNGVTMADGNMIGSYNALNQPVAMIPTGTSDIYWFGYDPLGRCVKRTKGGSLNSGTATYFYYDAWNLVQEGPSAGYTSRLYIHGGRVDEIVASWESVNDVKAYHYYDANGNCTLLAHWNGSILEQYYYDAFGKPYFFNGSGAGLPSSTFGNRFPFTGREYLNELKLYDYRNRMYQPELGCFLQPDPLGYFEPEFNLYRYCQNDPVNCRDPFGLFNAKQFFSGLGYTAGGAIGIVGLATLEVGSGGLATGLVVLGGLTSVGAVTKGVPMMIESFTGGDKAKDMPDSVINAFGKMGSPKTERVVDGVVAALSFASGARAAYMHESSVSNITEIGSSIFGMGKAVLPPPVDPGKVSLEPGAAEEYKREHSKLPKEQ